MQLWFLSSAAFLLSSICIEIASVDGAKYLRQRENVKISHEPNDSDKENAVEGRGERRLEWIVDQLVFYNDPWASENYSDDEIPKNTDKRNDAEDFLRDKDECLRNGKYDRRYCLKPPNCKAISKHHPWDLKLCINRVPKPENPDKFYAKVMKCIPKWENCDKCMCGVIKSRGRGAYCSYTGASPDDDYVSMSCRGDHSFSLDSKVFMEGPVNWGGLKEEGFVENVYGDEDDDGIYADGDEIEDEHIHLHHKTAEHNHLHHKTADHSHAHQATAHEIQIRSRDKDEDEDEDTRGRN